MKERLAAHLLLAGFARIEFAIDAELRRGREVEQLLEFRHEMHLAAALENVHPFFGGDDRVAVEVSGALLELGEILDGFQRALRTEEALNVHPAQAGRFDAMAKRLRPDVADEMRGAVGMAVGMAIKAGDPARRAHGAAVVGVIELLLHERRDEEPHTFEVLGIEDAVEDLEEVIDRHELAFRDVAEIGPRGEENRGGELRQK